VHHHIVAVHAQTGVDTSLSDRLLAMLYSVGAHRGPTEEEGAQPHVEDKHEIGVAVGASDTVVSPNAVALVPIDTLVADMAVLGARCFDDLAVRAQILARHSPKYLHPAQVRIRLEIAWFVAGHVAKRKRELRHAHRSGEHEVPNVEDRLDYYDLVYPYENEQEEEEDLGAFVFFDWHVGQFAYRAARVPLFCKDTLELFVILVQGKLIFCELERRELNFV